jgi:release factor glutamine methyltransferase
LESDWYSAFETSSSEKIDIIVSNPPYLMQCEFDSTQDEIRKYEPIGAFVAENDGFRDIKIILNRTPKFLENGESLHLKREFCTTHNSKSIKIFSIALRFYKI